MKFRLAPQQVHSNKAHVDTKMTSPTVYDQLAQFYNVGRFAEMETNARALIEQQPDSGILWKALGASLRAQGKDAVQALRKAVQFTAQRREHDQ